VELGHFIPVLLTLKHKHDIVINKIINRNRKTFFLLLFLVKSKRIHEEVGHLKMEKTQDMNLYIYIG